MTRFFATMAGALLWAFASIAAPFDCTKGLPDSIDYPEFRYGANEVTRIVGLELSLNARTGFDECSLSGGTGNINSTIGRGSIRFDNDEVYRIDVRGDVGTQYLGYEFDYPDLDDVVVDDYSTNPPPFRLELRPFRGRNLDYTYPNGFSLYLADCVGISNTRPPGACEFGDEYGPFFLATIENGRLTSFGTDGGGPFGVAAVPLPAGLPLILGALGALGWVTRRRASPRPDQ